MDDIMLFIVYIALIVAATFILLRFFALKHSIALEESRTKARVSANARRAALAKVQKQHGEQGEELEGEEVGEWLTDMLEEFGINPSVVYEEEMPEELKRLLPMAKAFVSSGGLQKLLANNQSAHGDAEEEIIRRAI